MPNDEMSPSEARDFVMARVGAGAAAATSARDLMIDVLNACADGDTEMDRAEALSQIDDMLGEASRAVQLAQELIEQVDPEEAEPDLPEGDGHDAGDDGAAGE